MSGRGSESAFPEHPLYDGHLTSVQPSPGLTKRELLAAMALQGLCSWASGASDEHQLSAWARDYADALIAALNDDGGDS